MVVVAKDLRQSVNTRFIAEKAHSSSALEMGYTSTMATPWRRLLLSSLQLGIGEEPFPEQCVWQVNEILLFGHKQYYVHPLTLDHFSVTPLCFQDNTEVVQKVLKIFFPQIFCTVRICWPSYRV